MIEVSEGLERLSSVESDFSFEEQSVDLKDIKFGLDLNQRPKTREIKY